MLLRPIWSNIQFKVNISLLIFWWMVFPLLKVGYWNPLLLLYCCLFFFSHLLILFCVLKCSYRLHKYLQMLYPIDKLTLYHYIMTFFFSLVTVFGLKSILSDGGCYRDANMIRYSQIDYFDISHLKMKDKIHMILSINA